MWKYFIKRKNTSLEEVVPGKTRVILINKEYGIKSSEPVWGSSYQCAGIVERIVKTATDFPIVVKWDNGASAAYRAVDLQICSGEEMKSNPNFAFRLAKRGRRSGKGTNKETEGLQI